MSNLEQVFLDRITAEPEVALHRLVFADWLEEQGDPRAELLRIQEQLRTIQVPDRRQLERRMLELIDEGIQPLTILRTGALGLSQVLIFPGQFLMGTPVAESGHKPNETQRPVTLAQAFWLGRTEVTQGQWQALMRTSPWRERQYVREAEDSPVAYVSWKEAMEFCQALTSLEEQSGLLPVGWEYLLPTDAQWEYACRAGTTTRYSFGDDDNRESLKEYGWYTDSVRPQSLDSPQAVSTKQANPWNLFDMHGNVYEWCRDVYSELPPGGVDPVVTGDLASWVIRGGGWGAEHSTCRSGFRLGYGYDRNSAAHSSIGFRVALCRK